MWREWRLRPGRAVLTILSVAFAVAVVFGSSLAASMVRHAYAAVSTALEGSPASMSRRAGRTFRGQHRPATGRCRRAFEKSCRCCSERTSAHVAGKRWRTMVLGLSEPSAPPGRVWKSDPAGCRRSGGEALIDASVAESLGLKVPQQITVLARHGTAKLNVVGTVAPTSLREYGDGVTLVVPLADAQRTFGLEDQVDRVRVLVGSREDCGPAKNN